MGHKSFKKSIHHNIIVLPKTEEEIEDMKHIFIIHGVPILALNENIAEEIYNRLYNQ